MQEAPKGLRLQIGVFGKRNAGKSSILNFLTRQTISIVSDTPGTTTDPVEKAMEFAPLGPVLFIDTAGLDDEGALGQLRVERTRKIFERTDLAVIVTGDGTWSEFEQKIAREFSSRKVPVLAVFNKSDLLKPSAEELKKLENIPFVSVSAKEETGKEELRRHLIALAPDSYFESTPMLGDLGGKSNLCVLVTPIDIEAPRGRMILPQMQAVRDALDHDMVCVVVKENALARSLAVLKCDPDLVVTDSQAFAAVAALTPSHIPLTSFSILMARLKADLAQCAAGAAAIDSLKAGDKVLIAEACTHHPVGEDIGTVKIPKLLKKKTGVELEIVHAQGHDFPANLSDFSLVIHCGACTFNRREVLTRATICGERNIPFTNYGVAIAHCTGILERALAPFPGAYDAYKERC